MKTYRIKESITEEDKQAAATALDIHLTDDLPSALIAVKQRVNSLMDEVERRSRAINLGIRAEQQNEWIDERTQKWINKYSQYSKNDHPLNPVIGDATKLLIGYRELVITLEGVIEVLIGGHTYSRGYIETERYASINEIKKNIEMMEREIEAMKIESSMGDKSHVREADKPNVMAIKPITEDKIVVLQRLFDEAGNKPLGRKIIADKLDISQAAAEKLMQPFVDNQTVKSWKFGASLMYRPEFGKRLINEQPS